MRIFRLRPILMLGLLLLPASAHADPMARMWLATVGSNQYAIRFAPDGDSHCGLMHWMSKPKTPSGDWKLDTKNPNELLQTRRILGLTLLGRLEKGAGYRWQGRLYIPDPGRIPLIGDLDGVACDVELTFPAAGADRGEASVSGRFGSKCYLIAKANGPLELRRKEGGFQEPTASGATCAYQE